jgi:hypothetical protein
MTTTTALTTLPRRRQLLALAVLVGAVHGLILLGSGANFWRLPADPSKSKPLQTRVLSADPLRTANTASEKPNAAAQAVVPAPARKASPQNLNAADAGMQAVASAALPAPTEQLPESLAALAAQTDMAPAAAAENNVSFDSQPTELATPPANLSANAQMAKVGHFPDNTQINYTLTGQERGLNYHASGTLKWQVKAGAALPKAYEAELRVKAFLVGSRVWRSVGLLNERGLAPTRYSDSARSERAAHFETDAQKISFSGNLPSAPLLPGAQDQMSLFIQMAATVSSQSFKPGDELNVQTATVRDAVNWNLTYKADEFIEVNGSRLETQRWVCLPRGKFDSQIEMWLAKDIGGLPARIKISQVSGSFIDMEMRSSEALPALSE